MKRCTACGVEKVEAEFYKHSGRKDGLTEQCRECTKAKVNAYATANREEVRERNRAAGARFRAANRDYEAERQRDYYRDNKPARRASETKWRTANKHKHNAKEGARRAKKLLATPKWADLKRIAEVYEMARLESERLGVPVHVDHIVTLKSSRVCGLHCEQNLQLLVASDNLTKSNRVWPDM